MRILLVIHGYPMRFNAGSEVYTQTLARALADRHEVRVFTRQEDSFLPQHMTTHETDPGDARIQLHVVNNPESRDRYRHDEIDRAFGRVIDEFRPDVVHVNHVNHLSTSLIAAAAARRVPIVYTLHDFWLMCPRGQFIQRVSEPNEQPFPICDGQDDRKCAERCYSLYFSGSENQRDRDMAHWTDWVRQRMDHVRAMSREIDRFIAPSRQLLARYRDEFGIPAEKLEYVDYGFDRQRLSGRARQPEDRLAFGYIGTHTPAKGIHHLLEAFGMLTGSPKLRIWGRPREPHTSSLRQLAASLPGDAPSRIEWMGEYRNEEIIAAVFNRADAIVVPSIWAENSPLVIHEAQQARVPVITADVGGMAEYVNHGINGLLFHHRDPSSLSRAMQRLVTDPALATRLGDRGYLQSDSGDVPSINEHRDAVLRVYARAVEKRRPRAQPSGPWRITFDTNPDDCNLRCVMCEEHSPHSPLQRERRAAGRSKRRMDIDLIRRVLQECHGSGLREIIPSTMGEPLLYQHFDEVLQLCAEFGVKLNLTTNGTFPQRGAKAWAERIAPVGSDVKISINGSCAETQETIMLGTDFDAILSNAAQFISVRDAVAADGGNYCRVTFQTTFLASNVAELPDLVRLAASLGIDRVKGHHLWVHFDQIEGLSMRRSPESVRRWNSVVEEAVSAAATHLRPNGQPVLLENIHPLDPDRPDEIALDGECPFLGQEAWVSAEGRFDPCCAPDTLRRTLGDFGHLRERSLLAIWNGEAYQRLRARYRENALCQTCNMRRPREDRIRATHGNAHALQSAEHSMI